jgi:hypothetical protein
MLINGNAGPHSADPKGAKRVPPNAQLPNPQLRFFATDSVEKFERLGSRFLGHPVGQVQLVDLGG